MTSLFTGDDRASRDVPAEQAQQPTVSEKAVREQVQRVRLDLLARETERLDRRLAQILEQQQEDRQLRDRLQDEVGSLCQRVEQLIAGVESGAAGDKTGADLRTTVKPLLQAVLKMLDEPIQRAPGGDPGAPSRPPAPPQARQAQPTRSNEAAQVAAPPARRAPSTHPTPPAAPSDPIGSRPERPAASSRPEPGARPTSSNRLTGEVEARAVALQRALARLEQASAPGPSPRPRVDSGPTNTVPPTRRDPAAASRGTPSGTAARSAPAGKAAPADRPSARPDAVARSERPPVPEVPSCEPSSDGERDDSMAAEDPAIEIARLLRPMDAKPRAKSPEPAPDRPVEPVAKPPAPAAPPPAPQQSTTPELLLGTNDTPEVHKRVERQPPPTAKAGPAERSAVRQRLMQSAVARRATGTIARDRAAPEPSGTGKGKPEDTTVPPAKESENRAPPTSAEPETEPLPRCLTEPWDDLDAELGRLRDGQDKGARRWPFRRGRSGGQTSSQSDDERSD